jgi:hypothetical protein
MKSIVLVGLPSAAALIAAGLFASSRRGPSSARFLLQPIESDRIDRYIDREASFSLTVIYDYPDPPSQVFRALLDDRFMSWMPFTQGVNYADGARRDVGTLRALRNSFAVVAERIVLHEPDRLLGVTAAAISVPLVLESACTLYELQADGRGGTRLTWRVGGTPKWFGRKPLRLASMILRPAASWQIGRLRSIIASS